MSAVLRRLAPVLAVVLAPAAQAHKPSDSYLTIEVKPSSVEGRGDIALRDLDFALGLDADGNGELTWGELRARHAEIAAYAAARLTVNADDQPCTIEVGTQQVDSHTDGAYAVLRGKRGVTDRNVLLIAQLTTTGELAYMISLQTGTLEHEPVK